MRQQILVYTGRVELIEYPGIVVHDSVLAKPIYVYIGDVERALVLGYLPTPRPVTLGSSGVVRVVEVSGSSTEYTGKIYSVAPFGARGVLGVQENGVLATFTSLHPSYLDEQLVSPMPFDAIRPVVKHALELAKLSEEPVLIEGCGLVGIASGLGLRHLGIEPVFYCEERKRSALNYGFTTVQHVSELSRKWGSVVLTSTDTSAKYRVLTSVDCGRLLISRLSFTLWIPLRACAQKVNTVVVDRGSAAESALVKRVLSDLSRGIKVLTLNNLESSIGLFPPKGLGTIISFSDDGL